MGVRWGRARQMVLGALPFLLAFLVLAALPGHALQLSRFDGPDATVLCDPRLAPEAREVLRLYTLTRKGLEATLHWQADFRPAIVLVGDRAAFREMAGNSSYIAYAIPEKQVIVIDLTRMSERPFTLETTLEHELCHLLLHRRMRGADMPKWLDEGIAQWVSEGIPELAELPRESLLTGAALSGSLLGLKSIAQAFPQDQGGLALAYEESRSVVEYIVKRYGTNGVLNLLECLRKGASLDDAVQVVFMVTLPELERAWAKEQLGLFALLAWLVANIYTFLFVLAAVLTFWAYVRTIIRKRRIREQPEDEEGPIPPASPAP